MSRTSHNATYRALNTLADLAPQGRTVGREPVTLNEIAVLPVGMCELFVADEQRASLRTVGRENLTAATAAAIDQLAKRATIIDDPDVLRIGWLWLVGVVDGKWIMEPLVSRSVKPAGVATRALHMATSGPAPIFEPTGDVELTSMVTNSADQDRLGEHIPTGDGALAEVTALTVDPKLLQQLTTLQRWATDVATAAGVGPAVWSDTIEQARTNRHVQLVAQTALYLNRPQTGGISTAATLRRWNSINVAGTAFDYIYGGAESTATPTGDEPVDSSLVLSPAQRAAVRRSRYDEVTVVSGPPGTGKSQTIAAIALDAVERGQSVLVAAPTSAAVDALTELLTDTPGPDPIVFGSSRHRQDVIDRLGQGGGQLAGRHTVEASTAALRAAQQDRDELTTLVAEFLTAERMVFDNDSMIAFAARRTAPRWFTPDADLDEARVLYSDAHRPRRGLFTAWRQQRSLRRLHDHAGATSGADLGRALEVARARRLAQDLDAMGGLELDSSWSRLIAATERARVAKGTWLHATTHAADRMTRQGRATMALVASAMRSGRVRRRQALARVDGTRLADAMPLWVATLRDIDDLLPCTPAMFDLLVVDEASQADQVSAAPALLRAKRAVVVGDPKQLRHVSFIADAAIDAARAANQVTTPDEAGRLDVRRLSLFDIAASTSGTEFLSEHFRSAPHLIGFSAQRFYDGHLRLATRHPTNDTKDCISIDRVPGDRADSGVNLVEVDRVIEHITAHLADPATTATVGVMSPTRAQADAITDAAMEAFSLEEIERVKLRIGTVHGFQGCQRDIVLLSLAIDDDAAPGARAFIADPHLFNVMITRARHEIVVVTSLSDDCRGVIGDYIRYGATPPNRPRSKPLSNPLALGLAADLKRSGHPVTTGYPAGEHTLDMVLAASDSGLGIVVGPHPDGPTAHIDRHLALVRSGWEIRDLFHTKWADRLGELGVALALEADRRAAQQR